MATASKSLRSNSRVLASTQWIEQFGTLLSDGANGVAVDPKGNLYVTGYTEGSYAKHKSPELFYNNDVFVTKFSKSGKELWRKQFGHLELDDIGHAVTTDTKGNVYLAGSTYDALTGSGGTSDGIVVKLNSKKKTLWDDKFGTTKNDTVNDIALDKAGNVYMVGTAAGYGSINLSDSDVLLTKYNSKGQKVWMRQFDIDAGDTGNGIAVDKKGFVYVTGSTGSSMQGTTIGFSDAYLSKFSPKGKRLWTERIRSDYQDGGQDVAINKQGNIYFTGYMQPALGANKDVFLAKYNAAGQSSWAFSLPYTASDDIATGIAIDRSNAVYISGHTSGDYVTDGNGIQDAFVIKFGSNGQIIDADQIGTIGTDIANAIAVDSKGNAYITGYTEGSLGRTPEGYNDAFLAKFTLSDSALARQVASPDPLLGLSPTAQLISIKGQHQQFDSGYQRTEWSKQSLHQDLAALGEPVPFRPIADLLDPQAIAYNRPNRSEIIDWMGQPSYSNLALNDSRIPFTAAPEIGTI